MEPVVARNLDRHLSLAKEWFPHEYVPWSEGRTFDGPLGGEAWSPTDSTIPDVARTALIVNLLTEDNLPSYHHEIATLFGRDGAWGTWVHRWTAEEGRHGVAIRDYLTVTRAVDPVALERARMTHMSEGYTNAHGDEVLHSLAYVSFQELATRISHRNTGKATGDPACEALLARVAADENLHMVFYRNLLAAAFELAPSQAMRAVADVVADFQMPGSGIDGLRPQVGGDRPGRHLRPAPAPRRGAAAGAAPVGRLQRDRPQRRRRGRPRAARRPAGEPGPRREPLRREARRPSRPPSPPLNPTHPSPPTPSSPGR